MYYPAMGLKTGRIYSGGGGVVVIGGYGVTVYLYN